jgi:hypothetical protein
VKRNKKRLSAFGIGEHSIDSFMAIRFLFFIFLFIPICALKQQIYVLVRPTNQFVEYDSDFMYVEINNFDDQISATLLAFANCSSGTSTNSNSNSVPFAVAQCQTTLDGYDTISHFYWMCGSSETMTLQQIYGVEQTTGVVQNTISLPSNVVNTDNGLTAFLGRTFAFVETFSNGATQTTAYDYYYALDVPMTSDSLSSSTVRLTRWSTNAPVLSLSSSSQQQQTTFETVLNSCNCALSSPFQFVFPELFHQSALFAMGETPFVFYAFGRLRQTAFFNYVLIRMEIDSNFSTCEAIFEYDIGKLVKIVGKIICVSFFI